jgi:UDP-glucuronate decarboxylase
MVDALVKLMNSAAGFTGPVNLGNPVEVSMRELAEKILALTGSRSKLAYKPLPADDPRQRRPDISLAHKELGWQPGTPLDDGLKDTIQYFRKLLA